MTIQLARPVYRRLTKRDRELAYLRKRIAYYENRDARGLLGPTARGTLDRYRGRVQELQRGREYRCALCGYPIGERRGLCGECSCEDDGI